MEIKFNKKFEKLVGNNFSIEAIKPSPELDTNALDIVIVEGCYYFKQFALKGKLSDSLNKMEYEFDTNKIRVDDSLNTKISSTDALWYGLSLIKELKTKLLNLFGNGFEIILTYDYKYCFVRFYKIRKGINNVMSNDLEGFKKEAILRVLI